MYFEFFILCQQRHRNGIVHSSICQSLFHVFCTFPDKPSRGLISNMVDTFIMVLLRPDQLLVWLVKQFPCICRQTADQIELKFGGSTHYSSDTPPLWINLQLGTCIHWCLLVYVCNKIFYTVISVLLSAHQNLCPLNVDVFRTDL